MNICGGLHYLSFTHSPELWDSGSWVTFSVSVTGCRHLFWGESIMAVHRSRQG